MGFLPYLHHRWWYMQMKNKTAVVKGSSIIQVAIITITWQPAMLMSMYFMDKHEQATVSTSWVTHHISIACTQFSCTCLPQLLLQYTNTLLFLILQWFQVYFLVLALDLLATSVESSGYVSTSPCTAPNAGVFCWVSMCPVEEDFHTWKGEKGARWIWQ